MKYINTALLKEMFLSASNNLYNNYPEIDALNVFPVPDGDTGMNMNLTLSSGAKEIKNRNDNNVYDLAKAFSKGLLMGARGNSGVITSQIFRGFSNSLEGKKVINNEDLVNAFLQAKEVAYKAVIKPVEGTILTVCRESAVFLEDQFSSNKSIEDLFFVLIKEAENSLNRTPELLPVLKEVGVVDSGGYGYLTILKGMQAALLGKFIEKNEATAVTETTQDKLQTIGENDFGYCTEFIMRLENTKGKKSFNENMFINTLQSRGNSLVVVKDDEIVKVHIHTLNPGWILTYAQTFGEFIKLKIENMTEQHNEILSKEKNDIKSEMKEYGIIAVSSGKGIDEMFKEIGVDEIVTGGQTMNPSTEDFIKAINNVNAKNIFILPNNSNIVMAASQACDVVDENINAFVVPSTTIPQGLVAAYNFNPDENSENNYNEMKSVLKNVKSASVTYAIKDTEIDGVNVKKDEYMSLVGKHIISCVDNKIEALKISLENMVDEDSSIITVLCGEDIKNEEMNMIQEYLEEKYSMVDIDLRNGGQPVYSFIIGVE